MVFFGELLLVIGSAFMLLGGIGIVRFDDVYARMHSSAKAPALGMILIAIGAGFSLQSSAAWAALALVVSTLIITAPISAHITARAVHERESFGIDVVDELADDRGLDRDRTDDP